MKKLLSMLLVLTMAIAMLTLVACKPAEEPEDDGVMTHAEFVAAEDGTVVTIEAYVQAKQGWWDNKITLYLQDREGGYFVYNLPCSETDAAKLTVGTKIRITGEKNPWAGLNEINDPAATFEFVKDADTFVATAFDATSILDNEAELIKHQTELVTFKGLTVVSVAYKSTVANDDIYVTVKLADGEEHSFCVEVYLTGPSTEVYQTALTLEAGDVIDVEGFLYWYEGVNTHITAITVK